MSEKKEIIKAIEANDIQLFTELLKELISKSENSILSGLISKFRSKHETFEYDKYPDWTMLHIAAENGRQEIIEKIFELEPDFPVDIQDKDKRTPMQRAIVREHINCVKFFLDKGANPNHDMGKLNPIIISALHSSIEIFKLLIENGIDYHRITPEGNLLFFIAKSETIESEAYERAEFLLSLGIDVNHSAEKDGLRPMNIAIEMGFLNIVKLYIENGADLNYRDGDGNSPLLYALKINQTKIAEYFNSQGVQLTTQDIMQNIEIDLEYNYDDEEEGEGKEYSYQLEFHDVDEEQSEALLDDFQQYTWGMAFDVISSDPEYDSETEILKIPFTSRKYFIYEEPTDSVFSGKENPNLRPLERNIYYRLIGKEQYLSNLGSLYDDETDISDIFFIDDKNQKWSCEVSKYSHMEMLEDNSNDETTIKEEDEETTLQKKEILDKLRIEEDREWEESSEKNRAIYENLPKEYVNSLGMEFVLIPPGEFLMGAVPQDEEALDDEKPKHKVRITKPFYIGKYPVTQEEWEGLMGNNPSDFEEAGKRAPVDNVSWDDCQEYIKALNQKEGKTYRLPTEAEWEYAARGGGSKGSETSSYIYTYGDDPSVLGDYAWYEDNSNDTSHPVGEKKPNSIGLYDMMGNVWEWCGDFYDENYYRESNQNNPTGPMNGEGRSVRGGSWGLNARSGRLSLRGIDDPDGRGSYRGFRLLLLP